MEDDKGKVDSEIFRAYDIRGIYPKQLDENTASAIGRAYGRYIGENKNVVVGMDIRLSSESLSKELIKSILACGVNATFIGVVPTPVHFFSVYKYGFDGGITVSASHNPPEWNGFKMYGNNAQIIGTGSGMESIRDMVYSGDAQRPSSTGNYKVMDVLADYETYVLGKVSIDKSIAIGIDPGNGAYANLASHILKKTPIKVTAINDVRDGNFPSRSPEPKPDTITGLMKVVKQDGLAFGVAYDGDGDRAVFVDENGAYISPDKMLGLFVKAFVKKGERVVYDVSCSDAIEDAIKAKGGIPVLSKVGRPYLQREMANDASVFGAELSGHLYFKDIYGIDDGFFASLKLAEILSGSSKRLSELVSEMPSYPRHVEELKVEERYKYKLIDALRSSLQKEGRVVGIDGVKLYTPRGWFLIRASNTGPMVRLIAEGRDEAGLQSLLNLAREKFTASYNDVRSV